jgi:hypothetical protein
MIASRPNQSQSAVAALIETYRQGFLRLDPALLAPFGTASTIRLFMSPWSRRRAACRSSITHRARIPRPLS